MQLIVMLKQVDKNKKMARFFNLNMTDRNELN